MKQWNIQKLNKEIAKEISEKYNFPPLFSILLTLRGITNPEDIQDFINSDKLSTDPNSIKDMDKAVIRIKKAIKNNEKICIFGDYDADGVTATALLYSYLKNIGGNVTYYIPSRDEGYGLNKKAIFKESEKGVNLIITVDNGVSSFNEIEYAKTLNIDTVVTDHHMPPDTLPNAVAVVNMHRKDCKSKFKDMAGVGVAFMLVMALEGEDLDEEQLLDNYSDLIAIGTVGDLVPLLGDNRVFVKKGLYHIQNSDRYGILALINKCGLLNKEITSNNLAFSIIPRINAVGRLGFSAKCVDMLLTDNEEKAIEIATEMDIENRQRQELCEEIFTFASKEIEDNINLIYDNVIVINGKDWHQGVIGIVASKIKEKLNKPVIVISTSGGVSKGSGRSIKGFSLCDAVAHCEDLLIKHGGHPMAVGFQIKEENIEEFRKRINKYASKQEEMPFEQLDIACKLNPAQLDVSSAHEISHLEPFGQGNPSPIFGLYNMELINIFPIGNNKHLRLTFKRGNSNITGLNFFVTPEEFSYKVGDIVDLAVTLSVNNYRGREDLSIILKGIKFSNVIQEEVLKSNTYFENTIREEKISPENAKKILPTREDFANVYRFLMENKGYSFSSYVLMYRLNNSISYGKLKVILNAMEELGLIKINRNLTEKNIKLLNVENKVDLESAQIIKTLKEVGHIV